MGHLEWCYRNVGLWTSSQSTKETTLVQAGGEHLGTLTYDRAMGMLWEGSVHGSEESSGPMSQPDERRAWT